MVKWKLKIPDYFGGYWRTFDTYSSWEWALKEYEQRENAKLIRVEESTVKEKGSLPSDK